jgi:putative transposase
MFEEILMEAKERFTMPLLAYCLMPNHFHLVIYPNENGSIQKFMQWLTLTHTQRWHAKQKSIGSGHLYQGRYKSFLIQEDNHLLTVLRYVERNPLRAKLVKKSENWKFSSLFHRLHKTPCSKLLSEWPILKPKDYVRLVNTSLNTAELEAIRHAVNKSKPYGNIHWVMEKVEEYGLEASIRGRGRPKKGT